MPNTESRFNPAYSTVKSIYLGDIDILKQNTMCRFERMELVENANEMFPRGVLLLVDLNGISTMLASNLGDGYDPEKIEGSTVKIEFFNGKTWVCDITSVSYENNAASKTEETIVSVHFTNSYYKYFSSKSLVALLGYKKPNVFYIPDFVKIMKEWVFGADDADQGIVDDAKNYFLYKPFNPFDMGDETPSDNAITVMNYLTTGAIDKKTNEPNFLFWTSFGGGVNFKSFRTEPSTDDSFSTIDSDYRNFAIFNSEDVLQKISKDDDQKYRKIYWLNTNPGFQWVSKNYFYIRKTPKYVDKFNKTQIPDGLSGDDLITAINAAEKTDKEQKIKDLMFHFQDDGQKYNIEVVTIDGRGTKAPDGGNPIYPDNSWGYYELSSPTNEISVNSLLGNDYGTSNSYKSMNLMGSQGYMPYLDSPDMWKNMFDMTPVHPHHPFEDTINPEEGIPGENTTLQKIIDIRYDVFKGPAGPSGACGSSNEGSCGACGGSGASGAINLLDQIRNIEKQNFIMYALCCMGKREDCFFAALTRYEPDSAYYTGTAGSFSGGPSLDNDARFYRYKWNKLIYCGTTGISGSCGSSSNFLLTGSCGPSGLSGPTGCTHQAHQLERWSFDPTIKASDLQDETWAINLNERGLSSAYLPPGWVETNTGSFKFRPIGANDGPDFSPAADIYHIARVCIEQVDAKRRVVYFWAENTLDGEC